MSFEDVLEFGRNKGKEWMVLNNILYVDESTNCKCFNIVKLIELYKKDQE